MYADDFGEVHGFVDYRVRKANESSLEVELTETGDSVTDAETGGFSIDYENLQKESLTLRATVTATRKKRSGETTDEVIIKDTVDVEPYNISSRRTAVSFSSFPNGDTAVFAFRSTPWSSIRLQKGTTVHSNWRFFSARDTDWDERLVVSRGSDGIRTVGEKYHPLQVHAYPSRTGVYTEGNFEVTETVGNQYLPPELPRRINVDLPNSTYTTVNGVGVRYNGTPGAYVTGILNGQGSNVRTSSTKQRIRSANLTVSEVGRMENGFTLEVSLRDEKGHPIDTRSSDGYVRLEGHGNVSTGLDGTATVNITARPPTVVFARYAPEEWHDSLGERDGQVAYLGDTETVTLEEEFRLVSELGFLMSFLGVVLPILILVYFLDRMLRLGIWPPWRRI